MKAGKYLCCALAIGVLALGVTALGQEIRLEPISSTCGSSIDSQQGNNGVSSEIVLDTVPCDVTLEIKLSGWAAAPGTPTLGAYQATLDSAGFASGDGCAIAPAGGCPPGIEGVGAWIDAGRADFVFFGLTPVPAVSVADCNFEYGSTIMGDCQTDDGSVFYGGTLVMSADLCAKGTYTLDFNPADTKTFLNDCGANKIPGLFRTPGKITIPTGKCCWDISPSTVKCSDGECFSQCMAHVGGTNNMWFEGVTCTGPEAPAFPASAADCPTCTQDFPDCDDGNVCTEDHCDVDGTAGYGQGICYRFDLYDAATYCCNPTGPGPPNLELIVIDDGNQCTDNDCNADGTVDHPDRDGETCVHPNDCVINDTCNADVCEGDMPPDLMIPCPGGDPDCPSGWFCEVDAAEDMFGFCNCRLETPLNLVKDDKCYAAGDTVEVVLEMGAGSAVVTGFQAMMTYDPCCVEFVSVGPCADSIFGAVVDWWVDEINGVIWYAAISYVDGDYALGMPIPSTTGPYDLACMEFIKLGADVCDDYDECAPNEFCIISDNPYNTLLTDEKGKSVMLSGLAAADPPCIYDAELDTPLTLYVPGGQAVNPNCGVTYATVTWDTAPYAEDVCNEYEIVCDLDHDLGLPVPLALIAGGGMFPQGKTYFVCTATDLDCGGEVTKVWTVDVSDKHALDVEVHLGPTMYDGEYDRCICFYLYDSGQVPEEFCTTMTFGDWMNFPDHAQKTIKIDKGNYVCIEARDPLHTLRSTADVECIGNAWTAVFKGDPALQYVGKSHWLVGGNLDFYEPGGNGDVIDILDFGVYMHEVSMSAVYGLGNTCGPTGDPIMLYPHADINGDGAVDPLDYAFLTENYLADSKHGCFEEPGSVIYTPVLDLTVKELRQRGMGHLAVADLNGDGRLNGEDMAAYSQGAVPTPMKVNRLGR